MQSTTKKLLLPRIYNEQSKFNKKDTVICHFCKRLMFRPYPHTENYKQWQVDEIHKYLKCYCFDQDLEEYLELKEEFNKENKKEIFGNKENTTNNVMELTAVIEGLKLLKFPCEVDLYSDSAYVVNAFDKGWIYGWLKNNWVNSSKEPVKNKELWQELYNLTKVHKVNFIKVKGHADNEFNNRCDELARNAIKML